MFRLFGIASEQKPAFCISDEGTSSMDFPIILDLFPYCGFNMGGFPNNDS